jgi:CubicO group peptidase (beta-lactamase class C family)
MRSLLPGIFILLVSSNLFGQKISGQNITTGKIIFHSKAMSSNDLRPADLLTDYLLTNKSNLFITVFLKDPLTNDMHSLAPEIPIDSLAKWGNYQFSFFVDSRLVYETNLLPGAPRAAQQQTDTVWTKPLIDNQHEGAWWSQSAWNRFMLNGGDSVLTDGHHTLKIEFRPYVKTSGLKVGGIIASGELNLEVKRKPVINLSAVHLSPLKPYNGFEISKESFDQNKIRELKANVEADVYKHITSIVVIKNGKILVEEYFNGANRDSIHDVRSVGKSFTSTLTGIAIHEGYLKSEDQLLKEFYDLKAFANYSSEKDNVSIKQLLSMSSAFDGNDDDFNSPGNEENMYPTTNWVKFALDLHADAKKYTTQWHYFTGGLILLGDILNKSVPVNLESYADSRLFKPLGISNYKWQYTPQKVVNTAGGIKMNALDFAKYGQLYKNGGKWNGKQLIPAEWVTETFSKQKKIPDRNEEYYGYLFWNKTYHVNGKDFETYYCAGNGGSKIFVFKDQPLVIVVTATAYGAVYAHPQVDQMMTKYILPAVLP